MKKILLVAPVVMVLAGCNSDHDRQVQAQQQIQAQQQQIFAQQQQLQTQQAEYQQQYAPPVQQYAPPQPQYAQPPVVVHQAESSSGVGSFVAGAAAGALAGHVYNKMNEQPTGSAYDSHHSAPATIGARGLQHAGNPPTMPTVALPAKKNYMDTAKFGSVPPVNLAKPAPVVSKPAPAAKSNFMNMSKLSKR